MRSVNPLSQLTHPIDYPAVTETHPDLSRRRFLLAGSGAAAGALIVGLSRSRRAAAQGKTRQIALTGLSSYVFRYGNYRLEKVVLQYTDLAQAGWLDQAANVRTVEAALRQLFDAHSCVDLQDGKKLAALQLKAAATALQSYRNATRRNGPAPTAVLFVGLPYARCKGDCPAPVPYCRPPARP
jgi:hypothetical protein